MQAKFANVIFPLATPKLYAYTVPDSMKASISIGQRVEVSLRNKLYSAVVYSLHDHLDVEYKTKSIVSIIDTVPVVTKEQLKFWTWIADYYCCTLGEVMQIAMPSGLKLESETKVILRDYNLALDSVPLSDDEYLIAEAVSIQNELTILQIQDILNKKTIFPVLRGLLDKGIITIKEELIEKFKARTANFITLQEPYASNSEKLNEAFELISRSDKQTRLLLAFIQLSKKGLNALPAIEVCKLADVPTSTITPMVKKGIFSQEKKAISRINNGDSATTAVEEQALSTLQQEALQAIETYLYEENKPVLLHGVTGSGKTRIYTEMIKKLSSEEQTLYLLPEIVLTAHMVDRLKAVFGEEILVYHSRMNNNERVEIWKAVMSGAKIVIGARSALFLPFRNLKLIIVDEEHDTSYKQYDPSPRYNARDAALFLANMMDAKIILGSATPSIDSYFNAANGKYGLVEMQDRYGTSILPSVEVVDLKDSYKDKTFRGTFSPTLIEKIEQALAAEEQIILFQNRRGYAPTLSCGLCGWKAECDNCDVHLTVHKLFYELRCHYCGTRSKLPQSCPACGNTDLKEQGFGTEKIEEELKELFPHARVARMDYDTTHTKSAFENIIYDFESRKTDILVGTQMVTKGLDFDNISLVGVLNADTILRYPDFRASERAFQMLTQVSGRAGRRQKQGNVIIQTYSPTHPVIVETVHHLYPRFFERESNERKIFRYPPWNRMIQLELLHKNAATVKHAATELAELLRKKLGNRVIGPAEGGIPRIRGQYIFSITIKMEKDFKVISAIKKYIIEQRNNLKQIPACKSVRINIDVDPY
ncbi:MAG: primosomal protein N' [Saprospiraceae bacterium]|nr:MAG: primosomal protein N' [Bacteroidetes bacterium OLB9]MCO6464713.1 primosomal protein N' [Saprospiraceae bacterium]